MPNSERSEGPKVQDVVDEVKEVLDVLQDPVDQEEVEQLEEKLVKPKKTRKKAAPKKTLNVANIEDAKSKISDIEVVGDGDMFQLLCKASSKTQGWMKSSKAMQIGGMGCVVQVTTQQVNPDGSYSVAEALTYVPGAKVVEDKNGGKRLA